MKKIGKIFCTILKVICLLISLFTAFLGTEMFYSIFTFGPNLQSEDYLLWVCEWLCAIFFLIAFKILNDNKQE